MAHYALICTTPSTPEPAAGPWIAALADRGHTSAAISKTATGVDWDAFDGAIIVDGARGTDPAGVFAAGVTAVIWGDEDPMVAGLTNAIDTPTGWQHARYIETSAGSGIAPIPELVPAGSEFAIMVRFATQDGTGNRYGWTAGQFGAGTAVLELVKGTTPSGAYAVIAWPVGAAWADGTTHSTRVAVCTIAVDDNYAVINESAIAVMGQVLDWAATNPNPGPTISSYTADPSTVSAGGSYDLIGVAAVGTPGNTLEYLHERISGAAEASLVGTATDTATGTGSSPASQIARTYRLTVTEKDGADAVVGTATAQVGVIEQAVPVNPTPVILSASITPQVVPQGDEATGDVESDLVPDAYDWDDTSVPWSLTTVKNPVVNTAPLAPGDYPTSVRTQTDGVWSNASPLILTVVAAGQSVGEDFESIHPILAVPGAATISRGFQLRAVGGGDLPADTTVAADKFGIVTEGPWRPGGDVNVEV